MSETNAQSLIGCEEFLVSTANNLQANVESGINPQFVYVQGEPGLGKTTFVETLAEKLPELFDREFIIIRLETSRDVFSREKLKKRILNSVRSDDSWCQTQIIRYIDEFKTDGEGNPEGPILKELLEYCQNQARDEGLQPPSCVIILDDYEKFSRNERTALEMEILRPLSTCNFADSYCLLFVTSDLSISEARSNFGEIFGVLRNHLNLEMKPFTPEDLRQYLENIDLSSDLFEILWEKSGGNWNRLHHEIQSKYIPKNPSYWDRIALNVVHKNSDTPKKWIFLAGLLMDYEIDLVEVFMEPGDARLAVRWVSEKLRLFLHHHSKPRSLKGELAFALRRLYTRMEPEQYRVDINKAEALNELVEEVSDLGHRQILARLAMFSHFNKDVLQEVIPESAAELIRFVDKNPRYFTKTEGNMKIRPNLHRKLREFRQIKRISNTPEETQRLNRLWRSKKDQYEGELKKTREFLSEGESTLKEINTNLNQLQKQMSDNKRNVQKQQRRETSDSKKQRRFSIGIADILLQLSGIILIYLCIIFSDYLSVAYIPLGVLLIVVGFLQPRFTGKSLSPVTQSGVSLAIQENESSNHLLELKMENLKSQRSMVNVKLAKIKNQVKHLQTLVDESYVS